MVSMLISCVASSSFNYLSDSPRLSLSKTLLKQTHAALPSRFNPVLRFGYGTKFTPATWRSPRLVCFFNAGKESNSDFNKEVRLSYAMMYLLGWTAFRLSCIMLLFGCNENQGLVYSSCFYRILNIR